MASTIWKHSATSMVSLRLLGPGSACLNPQNSFFLGGGGLSNKQKETNVSLWVELALVWYTCPFLAALASNLSVVTQ